VSALGKAGAILPVQDRSKLRSSVRLVASVAGYGCEAYTVIAWGVGLSQ